MLLAALACSFLLAPKLSMAGSSSSSKAAGPIKTARPCQPHGISRYSEVLAQNSAQEAFIQQPGGTRAHLCLRCWRQCPTQQEALQGLRRGGAGSIGRDTC